MKKYRMVIDYESGGGTDKKRELVEDWYKASDVEGLIEPPSRKVCPECPTCQGKGFIPIYYTPEERKAWLVENGLPVTAWRGCVYIHHVDKNGRYLVECAWRICSYNECVSKPWIFPPITLCAMNLPCPPPEYRHGGTE